ncbi:MAG: Asp-tRNA(Asn)/Glu-tRNA(Gln) amidotransferase subunit GatC [Deltaproteobacteria bacterium]|nr:Asp-tRNA(Asn)/Glu-tRNA(Gln) amidotransferase subunit GatC [Deltaproteobacteria bacterium]MBI4224649.1 Asp-tRNA(Asn)/Glu-tRNA(Gln) amidotransferase subunit GatC [Deltaproteobacteria bacterium]
MKKTIEKMVRLARLKLPEKEMERFAKKAGHIVEYIEKLKEIDTDKIEPTSHAIEVTNAFREDEVRRFENPAKILEIAPAKSDNLFEVPKVIEE